jgi:hypothetical protein
MIAHEDSVAHGLDINAQTLHAAALHAVLHPNGGDNSKLFYETKKFQKWISLNCKEHVDDFLSRGCRQKIEQQQKLDDRQKREAL